MLTPDLDRREFAFVPADPSDARRIAIGRRILVDGAFTVGSRMPASIPRSTRRRLERGWAKTIAAALDMTVEVDGLDHIDSTRSYVVMSLHESFVDIPALLHLPTDLRFTVREELIDHPDIGPIIASSGQIVVPDSPTPSAQRSFLAEVRSAVDAGDSVVVFPQGSLLGVEIAFRSGVGTLARALGLPILPVAISGTHKIWDYPFDTSVSLHTGVSVQVLPAIEPYDATAKRLRETERELKDAAMRATYPVRRFKPEQDGWWDDYTYAIDADFPDLALRLEEHRSAITI